MKTVLYIADESEFFKIKAMLSVKNILKEAEKGESMFENLKPDNKEMFQDITSCLLLLKTYLRSDSKYKSAAGIITTDEAVDSHKHENYEKKIKFLESEVKRLQTHIEHLNENQECSFEQGSAEADEPTTRKDNITSRNLYGINQGLTPAKKEIFNPKEIPTMRFDEIQQKMPLTSKKIGCLSIVEEKSVIYIGYFDGCIDKYKIKNQVFEPIKDVQKGEVISFSVNPLTNNFYMVYKDSSIKQFDYKKNRV